MIYVLLTINIIDIIALIYSLKFKGYQNLN